MYHISLGDNSSFHFFIILSLWLWWLLGRFCNNKVCISMDSILGLLKLRVKRGINLAIRDARTSDPYVVVNMGEQVRTLLFLGYQFFSFAFPFEGCTLMNWVVCVESWCSTRRIWENNFFCVCVCFPLFLGVSLLEILWFVILIGWVSYLLYLFLTSRLC